MLIESVIQLNQTNHPLKKNFYERKKSKQCKSWTVY